MPVPSRAASPSLLFARLRRWALPVGASAGFGWLLAGCANPGPPHAPSLQIPAVVQTLHAQRVGSEVRLSWTTPTQTTDRLPIRGEITAEICRVVAPAGGPAPVSGCNVVLRKTVLPGPTEMVDRLPGALLADPVVPVEYQVRLLNAAGRSAGNSPPALAAAGQAPPPVARLEAVSSANGVRLTWVASATPEAAVELTRTQEAAPGSAPAVVHHRPGLTLPGASRGSRENEAEGAGLTVRLLGAPQQAADAGGTLDQTAHADRTYSYTAERVRRVMAGRHGLTLQSEPSAAVSLKVRDEGVPRPPTGLEAVTDRGAVELSWEPDMGSELAGYAVFRAPLSPGGEPPASVPPAAPWVRLTAQPVSAPTFEDKDAPRGGAAYRVSAIASSGNSSGASDAVVVSTIQP